MWLRILPLGASITYGYTSNDGNGYRKFLRDMIVDYGNPVNMVGSRRNGTMEDNDVEGWPGDIIDQVHAKAKVALPKVTCSLLQLHFSFYSLHLTSSCIFPLRVENLLPRTSFTNA